MWTVDIAYVLHRFHLQLTFLTSTKGVRADYEQQPFYRTNFSRDSSRVTALFDSAPACGVNIVEHTAELPELIRALQQDRALVLVLVDKRMLSCPLCQRHTLGMPADRIPRRLVSDGRAAVDVPPFHSIGNNSSAFLGHYVLLYAYDEETSSFVMKDPASGHEACVIHADVLERARRAFGTDNDIILIGDRPSSPLVSHLPRRVP